MVSTEPCRPSLRISASSSASELPFGGVGPASTSRPSQPRRRSSPSSRQANGRFLWWYEAPSTSRNGRSSVATPVGRWRGDSACSNTLDVPQWTTRTGVSTGSIPSAVDLPAGEVADEGDAVDRSQHEAGQLAVLQPPALRWEVRRVRPGDHVELVDEHPPPVAVQPAQLVERVDLARPVHDVDEQTALRRDRRRVHELDVERLEHGAGGVRQGRCVEDDQGVVLRDLWRHGADRLEHDRLGAGPEPTEARRVDADARPGRARRAPGRGPAPAVSARRSRPGRPTAGTRGSGRPPAARCASAAPSRRSRTRRRRGGT